MKICIASSGLGHVARGIEAWASDLACALNDRGVAVSLCKGGGSADRPFETVISCWQRASGKVKTLLRWLPRRLGWRLGLGSGYSIEQTTFAWGLLRHLRRTRSDILHVQDPQVAVLLQRAHRLGLVRTRTILAHGTEEPPSFLQKIDYLQHLAPWHLEDARAAGAWKPAWTAIPNFIDTELFRPGSSPSLRDELQIPQNALVVLTAAAIKRHHKRIDYLLDEFGRLRQSHPELPAWLVIAGGWEQDTDELVTVGRQRLGDRVRFLVRFPRVRMPELYRAADVFTLCSLKEMMPIALIEATATGLPCVVNGHPVMEWMTGAGGRAIDMSEPGRLAATLAEVLGNSAVRTEMSESARRHCLSNFSRDRVVDQMLDYYRFVAADGRAIRASCRMGGVFGTHRAAMVGCEDSTHPTGIGGAMVGSEDSTHPTGIGA